MASVASRRVLDAPPSRPFLMFISLIPDSTFKHVVIAPLDAPDGPRYLTPLQCDRVYYAASRGLCLMADATQPDKPGYFARIFDDHFTRIHSLPLTGAPSRTRLSPDGRRAAFTVFDEGHSYADGVFSTRTTIVDTSAGTVIGDLESWKVTRDGAPFANKDFNFWGVTFAADGNTFYATLRTQGSAYLIEGHVDARDARVLLQGAECPSLSPDQTRVGLQEAARRRRRLVAAVGLRPEVARGARSLRRYQERGRSGRMARCVEPDLLPSQRRREFHLASAGGQR